MRSTLFFPVQLGICVIFLIVLFSTSVFGQAASRTTHMNVTLDRWYSGTVDSSSSISFIFKYRIPRNETRALRLQVSSMNATSVSPLMVVVREGKRVTSWEIPFYLEKTYPYWAVRRTLCPAKDFLDYMLGAIGNGSAPERQYLTIDITTQSIEPVDYVFNIWFIPGFILNTNKVIDFRISPSAPAFFQYVIPEGVDRVLVRAWAPEREKVCSYFSIQPAHCPIADLPMEIVSQGEYQTFTTRAGVTVRREDVQKGKFDVALVAMSEDHKCIKQQGWIPQLQKDNIDIAMAIERNLSGEWDDTSLFRKRSKHVFLVVENVLSDWEYWLAVLSVAGFYLLFYVVFRVALCFGVLSRRTVLVAERSPSKDNLDADPEAVAGKTKKSPSVDMPMMVRPRTVSFSKESEVECPESTSRKLLKNAKVPPTNDMTDGKVVNENISGKHDGLGILTERQPEPLSDSNVSERMDNDAAKENIDADEELASKVKAEAMAEAEDEGETSDREARPSIAKAVVTVTEVSTRPVRKMARADRAYNWTLMIIVVFYSLPVIQLVLTYQRVMETTGNMDMCYYNFECSHPTGRLSDFNHVYSNCGYVALGLLFCIIVRHRQKVHYQHEQEAAEDEDEDGSNKLGLPPQYGIFYSMGISLVMEGVMSACYHICPNYTNFQFDTSFMYLLGGLFMLKIYQARHADISPNAQKAYAVFAFWIFIAVLGVVIDRQWFWVAFAVILIVMSVPIGIQIYYMGTWKFDIGMFGRTLRLLCTKGDGEGGNVRGLQCKRPTATDRFVLLIMIFIINWLMAIGGAIFAPTDFSTFLLTVVLANAFFYFVFYIVMKIRSGETIPRTAQFFMLLAAGTWAAAIYFFLFRLTNWVLTPAISRQGNQHCFFLDFYDQHDVWHMLSACSMFFNFMILFTLDDDLFCVPRQEIRVF